MTHNPLHRIAKLRRELEALKKQTPLDYEIGVYGKIVCVDHQLEDHPRWGKLWTFGYPIRHTTEEHALKSAVRIARQKIAKMKRGG